MDADAGTCNVQGATHMAVEMYRMYMDERLLAQLDWAACYVYFETLLGETPQAAFRNIHGEQPSHAWGALPCVRCSSACSGVDPGLLSLRHLAITQAMTEAIALGHCLCYGKVSEAEKAWSCSTARREAKRRAACKPIFKPIVLAKLAGMQVWPSPTPWSRARPSQLLYFS